PTVRPQPTTPSLPETAVLPGTRGYGLIGGLVLGGVLLAGLIAVLFMAWPRPSPTPPGRPTSVGGGSSTPATPPLSPPTRREERKVQPALEVAPFDATEAKRVQQAWADFLGVKVVEEVDLGGGVILELVLIPPGEFLMGAPNGEKDATAEE